MPPIINPAAASAFPASIAAAPNTMPAIAIVEALEAIPSRPAR